MPKNATATATTADQDAAELRAESSAPQRLLPLTVYDWAGARKFALYRPQNTTRVYVDLDEIDTIRRPKRQAARFNDAPITVLPPRAIAVRPKAASNGSGG
jgi:hypothetical protein